MVGGVDVIVGVAVNVGMLVVVDTGVCAVEVSAGLTALVAVGSGDTSGVCHRFRRPAGGYKWRCTGQHQYTPFRLAHPPAPDWALA